MCSKWRYFAQFRLLGRFLDELEFGEACVGTVAADEVGVAAFFDDAAVVEHEDAVGFLKRSLAGGR